MPNINLPASDRSKNSPSLILRQRAMYYRAFVAMLGERTDDNAVAHDRAMLELLAANSGMS